MPTTVHATLGASSASRWMSCPGSIRLIDTLSEHARKRSSSYAKQGNAAHFLGEVCLVKDQDPLQYAGFWIGEHGAIIEEEEKPDLPGEWFLVDDEMVDGVRLYLDVVRGHAKRLGNAEVTVEKTVFPVPGREAEMFGTADVSIYEPYGELVVIDFKYGKGVVVETDWNDQMMYYGLGALRAILDDDEEVAKVTLVIVQPRAPHADGPVREWTLDAGTLLDFRDQLRSAADATKDPKAPLVPGDHCRFCPAAGICGALQKQILDHVVEVLPDNIEQPEDWQPTVRLPDPNNPKELGAAARVAEIADFWVREVNVMLYAALERGDEVPGYKLVRKRSQRRWKDPEDTERRLRNMAGLKKAEFIDEKLKSPAQLEKHKKLGKKWVERYAYKPEGGVTVAPESDPRPALAPMIEAFTEIED